MVGTGWKTRREGISANVIFFYSLRRERCRSSIAITGLQEGRKEGWMDDVHAIADTYLRS